MKAAGPTGSRLLRNAKIQLRISELRQTVVTDIGLTLRDHVAELARLRDMAEHEGKISAAITAEVARGQALGHQRGGYRPNLDDLTEAELEQVARGELPNRLRIA